MFMIDLILAILFPYDYCFSDNYACYNIPEYAETSITEIPLDLTTD